MSPFRSRPHDLETPIAASVDVHEAVGQMVRQFADPMAFLRELVQNGLDAGATVLHVSLDWQRGDGEGARATLEVTVRDDGAGMTQDVIERSLLVLFRSTKDRDPSKIGKFGVGFFSVFAPDPFEVRVDTGVDAAREGLRLRLRPDFTYELETSAPRRGTAVTLAIARSDDEARAFADATVEALSRWCPHVAVPLHVEVRGLGDDRTVRIDRPLSVEGDARITQRFGAATFCLAASPHGRAAFYNRGILLHETAEPLLAGVHLVVDSPELHHTLSRDDVRRDAAFAQLVARARALASGPLAEALLATLRALAQRCAEARRQGSVDLHARDFAALLAVAARDPFAIEAATLPWPLVAPVVVDGAARAWSAFDVKGWFRTRPAHYALDRTPLALALAARNVAVIDLGVAGDAKVTALAGLVTQCFGEAAVDVGARYCLPHITRATALDGPARTLLARVGALLGVADLGVAALGELVGAGRDRAWIALRDRDGLDHPALVIDVVDEAPFALARDRVVVLNAAHPAVRDALAAARRDAPLAAAVLARLVLLSGGRLDEERDLEILTRAALAEV